MAVRLFSHWPSNYLKYFRIGGKNLLFSFSRFFKKNVMLSFSQKVLQSKVKFCI